MSHPPSSQPGTIQYAVSWDANPQEADNNQGLSRLHVTAFDTSTGHIRWQREPLKVKDMYQSSEQRIVDGVLYITSSSQHSALLLALDIRDGHLLWQRETEETGFNTMQFCKGTIYQNTETTVQALQISNGQVRWSYKSPAFLSGLVTTSTAVYIVETEINAQSQNGQRRFATALDTAQGKVLWRKAYTTANDSNTFKLIVTREAVLAINQVASDPSTSSPITSVQALQPETGKSIWTLPMSMFNQPSSVTALGDTLYLNGQNQLYNPKAHPASEPHQDMLLMALDAHTGKLRWQREHNYEQFTFLSEQELYAYKGYRGDGSTTKKTLCALDTATGKDRWCIDSLQPSLFSLSANKDMLIVVETLQPSPLSLQQNLYAINKRDGKILWHHPWQSSAPSLVTLTLCTVGSNQNTNRLV
ncbi:hypothetical protein KSD_67670 [Ktedonobacter sp. SOSP1-85]|uniref:outer membrane protein assembly factor BamB family protein n=1 Tax=Ktedonobacter sp. SOSP1-85 TaxID=2778367 RepID=UPI001914FF8B|nr:PQQ-binding-like beta-propeller repeat protein [Ktedonobacter sp. SOSP1-85]GHO78996.1 hypothetical protein KSD_67670 [Ktedonobacter sp. SOSP1-85]